MHDVLVAPAAPARTPPGQRVAAAAALPWALVAVTALLEVPYPLVHGDVRDVLTVAAVLTGAAAAATHAVLHRGPRWAAGFLVVAVGGGLVAEAVGTRAGVPFGDYSYAGSLGAPVLGVPWVVPLAWAMAAYPALLVGRRLARRRTARVVVGAVALASWDLFLDPQMVAAGHWRWHDVGSALPGVPDVPLGNYAGWLLVSLVLMALLSPLPDRAAADGPPYALFLWTYASSLLANLAFFDRPMVALWGGLGMGLVAVPLVVSLVRRR